MPRPELQVGAAFARDYPDEAARVLESVPADGAAAFLADIVAERAAPVVAQMGAVSAAATLDALARASAAEVLARLSPAAAARIVRRLPDPAPILEELPEKLRAAVARLLAYPDGTAGAVADPAVLTVPDDTTVGDARRLLTRTPERAFHVTYVLDRSDRLQGVLDLRDLMAAPAGDGVSTIMRGDPARLSARADLRSAAADPAWLSHEALPVVDESDTFLGVLRHRVLRQRARATAGSGGPLAPFVGLAELYWAGFSRVLFGLGEPSAAGAAAKENDDAS